MKTKKKYISPETVMIILSIESQILAASEQSKSMTNSGARYAGSPDGEGPVGGVASNTSGDDIAEGTLSKKYNAWDSWD